MNRYQIPNVYLKQSHKHSGYTLLNSIQQQHDISNISTKNIPRVIIEDGVISITTTFIPPR
jgi:hypothetical protein